MPTSSSGSRGLRRNLALGATAGAAVISVRALFRPREQGARGIIDWETATRVASRRSGEATAAIDRDGLSARYDLMAAELALLMAEVCQAVPDGYPSFTVVDRHGFIESNLELAQRLLEPVERLRDRLPRSHATALGRALLSRYVGELFGIMSRRVLGQYDPVLMLGPGAGEPQPEGPRPALYLVEPNVAALEAAQGIPGDALRRWLILHELTHAWQFGAHPWLRRHLAELMQEMIDSALLTGEGPGSGGSRLRRLPVAVRAQLSTAGRIQAVMSVLEGYGNFVMHRVGRRHIEQAGQLEEAFRRRARERTALERLLSALMGINLKLRQYDQGEHFSEAVAGSGGLTLLNRVWEGPEMMPSMDELRRPELWMARAGG